MRSKKGWIRILEATISIMIISGVLLVVYSGQVEREDPSDYYYSLQKQVLADISSRADLRGYAILGNEEALNEFANSKVPDAFNVSVRVCDLGEICKMSDALATEAFRNDIEFYVEDAVISADFGEGYSPKKVVIFLWEAK